MVFSTFIVKDLLRDNLKNLTSAMVNTQSTFELNHENLMLRDQLDQLDTRLDEIQNKSSADNKKRIQIGHMIHVGQEINKMSWFELDHILPLAQKVSNHEQFGHRIQIVTQEVDTLNTTGNALGQTFRSGHEGDDQHEDSQNTYDATSTWVSDCQQAKVHATEVVNDTLAAAKAEIGRNEQWVK